MLSLFQYTGLDATPVRLASVSDLSSFGYFTRGAITEHLHFASRTVIQRTAEGTRQSIALTDIPFVAHSYVRHDGLAGVVVTDKEYPIRVAFTLVTKTMQDYEQTCDWKKITHDAAGEPDQMKKDLIVYQNPIEADKLTKIQKDLDDIKDIVCKNIEEVLKRGETLD